MAAAGEVSAVVVDALPYIDHEYDEPGVREAVLAMVEEETRRYRPTKNYLEHLPALQLHAFETDIQRTELERLQSRTPMDMISMKRYELPPPVHGRVNDLQAWTEAVDNSSAQLEQQVTRIGNLELLEKYGSEVWRCHNETLVGLARQLQGRLHDTRQQIQDIHLERKTRQTEVGEKLRLLESQWVGLVSKNYEIERACVEVEKEISSLAEARQAAESRMAQAQTPAQTAVEPPVENQDNQDSSQDDNQEMSQDSQETQDSQDSEESQEEEEDVQQNEAEESDEPPAKRSRDDDDDDDD